MPRGTDHLLPNMAQVTDMEPELKAAMLAWLGRGASDEHISSLLLTMGITGLLRSTDAVAVLAICSGIINAALATAKPKP